MTIQEESDHFSPYRSDGKLYGFVCVVTGANMPVGGAIVTELAGRFCNCLNTAPDQRKTPSARD
jgi:hypothetical protein